MIFHTQVQHQFLEAPSKRRVKQLIAENYVNFLSRFAKVILPVWFTIIGHFFVATVSAQDLEFTQFISSDNYVNPAFAGAGGAGRVSANYRNQWPNMPNTYLSYRIAYDQPLGDMNSGFGMYIVKDDQGDGVLNSFQLGFQYMYQIKLGPGAAINTGFQLGLLQQSLNWNKLQFFDQIDPVFGFNGSSGLPNPTNEAAPPSLSFSVLDIGAGAAIVTEKLFTGISFQHITQPTFGFYNSESGVLPMSVSFQTGVQIKQKKKRDPFIALPMLTWTGQAGANQLQIGSMFAKSLVMGGLFLKSNFSQGAGVSLLAGLRKDWLVFTYSYDVTSGGLSGETGGAHEIGVIFRLEDAGKSAKGKYYNVLMRPSVF